MLAAFRQRRVLEKYLETVAGALGCELLLSKENPDALCITVQWDSVNAHLAWLDSPVRAAQGPKLTALMASEESPVLMSVASTVCSQSFETSKT